MSEPIPESIPTSTTHRSSRPNKKPRLANTPSSQQSQQLEALFAYPDREVKLPPTSSALSNQVAAPPEIVTNVQGSSAGAGSGEFHVYKASRRRENERLRAMDEEVEREEADAAFQAKQDALRKEDEERLARNRAKREKAKARKAKGGKGGGRGMEVDGVAGVNGGAGGGQGVGKRKLGAAKVTVPAAREGDGEGRKEGERQATAQDEEEGGIIFHDDD